jgi:DNA-binding NarL/FixJ family response regulator
LRRQRRTTIFDRLGRREREVLQLMAEGRSNAGIAQQLWISPKTVEHYVAKVFVQLGLPEAASDNRRVLAVLNWLRSEI